MDETMITPTAPLSVAPKRISWAAVFAGVIAALVVQLVLGMIGLSIGASTIHPLEETAPGSGMSVGAGIWFVVTGLISLFAGGWVAGRLAGVPERTDSALHGLLAWGLATLVMTYALSTAVGGLISGATGVLGKSIAAVGGGAAGMGKTLLEEGKEELAAQGIGVEDIKAEALALLRDTGKPELQPESLGAAGERAAEDAKAVAGDAAKDPQAARAEVSALIDNLFERGDKALSAADKEAAVNVLVARSDMSREEASLAVDKWMAAAQQAKARVSEVRAQAEHQARATGEKVASGVARTAGWAAVAMILGGLAAAFGGMAGMPGDLVLAGRRLPV